jgi:putative ABC transport system permease protein
MGRIWRGLKFGLKSLLLHKLRSGLTVLGIVFGVAAVISMLAVGEGSSRDAQERIQQLGATNIIIRSVKPSDESQASGGRPARVLAYGLKYEDYDRVMATVPNIKKALPIREIRKQIRHLDKYLDGRVVGTTHDYDEFNRLEIARGRFLTEADNAKVQNYAVLASETAATLFPIENPIGQSIKLGSDYYTVIGVTKTRAASAAIGGSLAGQDFNKDVYIPLSTCRSPSSSARSTRSGPPTRSSRRRSTAPPTGRSTPRRTSTSSSPTSCCWRPSGPPGSSASSSARSPASRCWSAASGS